MRSDNLKRHENICQQAQSFSSKRVSDQTSSAISGSGKWSKDVLTAQVNTTSDEKKNNPRIQELVDEILNNGVTFTKPSDKSIEKTYEPSMKRLKSTNKSEGENGDDTEESNDDTDEDDDDDYDDDDDESNSDMDISDLPSPDKVKFLPATIDGLRARFSELVKKIAVDRKYGGCEKIAERNEAVFLLDELKRQRGISRRMYTEYKGFLLEAFQNIHNKDKDTDENVIATEKEEENEAEGSSELKKEIVSVVDYITKHDKKELLDIVNEFKQHEELIDVINGLEKLIVLYLEDDFIDGESIVGKIRELVERCLSDNEHIPRSAVLKINTLVDTIAKNRHRVEEIFNRFSQAGDDRESRLWILKQLAQEKHLSDDQYLKLYEMVDEINNQKLADVVKETKFGQGIDFMPRKTTVLLDNLRESLLELTEKGGNALQNYISAMLNELFQRKAISKERYNELKEENNIL